MKKYNYYYNRQPITAKEFLSIVPEQWEALVIDGEFSWGYYRAIEL